jgi:hypothetical protein
MAKQLRFKEAALLTQETAAAEDECESQAILFAMLQEQHNRQITVMTATNKANMDIMMERMNTLVSMVHAWVGQKHLKNYMFKSFLMSQS